jgi:hypothetical protein
MELALLGMFGVASLVMFLLTISTFIQTLTLGDSPMSEEQINLDSKEDAVAKAIQLLEQQGADNQFLVAVDAGESVEAVLSCSSDLLANFAVNSFSKVLEGKPRDFQIHVLGKFLQALELDAGVVGPAAIIAFGDHEKSINAMQAVIASRTGNNGSIEA